MTFLRRNLSHAQNPQVSLRHDPSCKAQKQIPRSPRRPRDDNIPTFGDFFDARKPDFASREKPISHPPSKGEGGAPGKPNVQTAVKTKLESCTKSSGVPPALRSSASRAVHAAHLSYFFRPKKGRDVHGLFRLDNTRHSRQAGKPLLV